MAGIALAALSALLVMALIQSAANLYLHRYVHLALRVCHQYQWYEVYYIRLVTKLVVQEEGRKYNH